MRRLAVLTGLFVVWICGAEPALADGGRLSRVSVGPVGGNGNADARFVGPREQNRNHNGREFDAWYLKNPVNEGTSAYFATTERLVPEDTDDLRDLYRRKGTQTELVTSGPQTGGPQFDYCPSFDPFFDQECPFTASRDGEHAFFATDESLVPEDSDGRGDLYERSGGSTTLLSTGPEGGNGQFGICGTFPDPCYFGTSADGDRAVFWTNEPLVLGDTSSCCADPYDRSGGVTRLLRGSSLSNAQALTGPFPISLNARHVFYAYQGTSSLALVDSRDGYSLGISGLAEGVSFAGASADGTRVFFRADTPITPDSSLPGGVYERIDNNELLRLPLGPPAAPYYTGAVRAWGPSWDGSHFFFSTRDRLSAVDTDDRWDLYAYSGQGIELVSTGPAGGNGPFDFCQVGRENCLAAVSRDGRKVYFGYRESLTGDDHDSACGERDGGTVGPCTDFYLRDLSKGTTELVSTGPGPDDGRLADFLFMRFDAISADGSRAFFRTQMSLVPEDQDGGRLDLYERFAGRTRLLSTGPIAPQGASAEPVFGGSTADGRLVFFTTTTGLLADDTDDRQDVYSVEVNEPPDCGNVSVSRPVLTTVNRRFVAVTLDGANDVDGDPVTLSVDGVTQDEPVEGSGNTTSPDAIDDGDGQLRIRAERDPHGDGRVYRIAFTVTDAHGGSCSETATVSVPRKKRKPAVDSAPPSYDSLAR
jgi:hypothetical protein